MENSNELEHFDLVLSAKQFDDLLNFWPPALKEKDPKSVVLVAYYKGEKYGIVHASWAAIDPGTEDDTALHP